MSKNAITAGAVVVAIIAAILLARRAEAAPLDPADVVVSDLVISPLEVFVGEHVGISVMVTNIGDYRGSYIVQLGGDFMEQKTVTLNAGESKPVTFQVTPGEERSYQINVNELSGSFIALAPPEANIIVSDLVIEPSQVYVGEPVTISVTATNIGNAPGEKVITLTVE